jgi:hypothetical protein
LDVKLVRPLAPLVILAIYVQSAAAQAVEQPKPDPEHKQLERWVGKWTYSGEAHANRFNRPANSEAN